MARYLVFALFLLGCPPPKPVPPETQVTCAEVCQHWEKLGCEEAEPTPNGGTCEDVCLNVQESGIISWDLDCRAEIASCDQVDSCEE
jgi:hypothetical protein